MRILTYKRTHTGDPNPDGVFGVNDCMGRIRDLSYDAVIGVGGMGVVPRSYDIDGKITWVGIYPTKMRGDGRGSLVTFQRFVLFDADGPTLSSLAPSLAKRMYEGKVRYLLESYSNAEKAEAEQIIAWAMEATSRVSGERVIVHKGFRLKCVCKTYKRVAC
jgi:hypothetical protein